LIDLTIHQTTACPGTLNCSSIFWVDSLGSMQKMLRVRRIPRKIIEIGFQNKDGAIRWQVSYLTHNNLGTFDNLEQKVGFLPPGKMRLCFVQE